MNAPRPPRRPSVGGAALSFLLAIALAISASGACTALPAPVIAPGATRPVTGAVGFGSGWGNAHARYRAPDGTTRSVYVNGDNSWGQDSPRAALGMAFIPAAFSIQGVGVDWDGGGYLGWRRIGAGARRLLLASPSGALTSLVFSGNVEWGIRAADLSAAVEHSPSLSARTRALLRLGVGYGRRRYGVTVPFDLQAGSDTINLDAPAHFELYRTDARIEALIGIALAGGRVVLAVEPYLVAVHGGIGTVTCPHCESGVELTDFAQDDGFSLTLTFQAR